MVNLANGFILTVLLSFLLFNFSSQEQFSESITSLEIGENVVYPDNEPPSIQIKTGNQTKVISDEEEMPSRPEISPDHSRLAFVAPLEFELAGDVWVYASGSGEKKKVLDKDAFGKDRAVHQILWADDGHLFVLVGNRYGTISLNNELYILDLSSRKLRSVLLTDKTQDIRDLAIREGRLLFNLATYNEDMTDFTAEPQSHSIEELLAR